MGGLCSMLGLRATRCRTAAFVIVPSGVLMKLESDIICNEALCCYRTRGPPWETLRAAVFSLSAQPARGCCWRSIARTTMAGYPPRNTSRAHTSGDSNGSSAPSYRLEDYPSTGHHAHASNSQQTSNPSTQSTTRLYEHDYATTELDGLNDPLHASPRPGDEDVDARNNNQSSFDVPYSHARTTRDDQPGTQSMDLSEAYATDATTYQHVQSSPSLSTHNSSSALRQHQDPTQYSRTSQPTPIHPGASVTMNRQESAQARRRYQNAIAQTGSSSPQTNEKVGYRSPRNRSHDRLGSSGLGNWSGPAGIGNSPYGQLGNSAPGSGLQSAASSSNNLAQIAVSIDISLECWVNAADV